MVYMKVKGHTGYVKDTFNGVVLNVNDKEIEAAKKRKLERKKHPMDIILMFVRKVGGRGVDMKFIRSLNKKLSCHRLSLAGGVKTDKEIQQLFKLGFCNVISSTLLHKRLSRDGL